MKTLQRCGQIGLTVPAMALAGRAEGAVDCARDGGPVEFGAAELDAALRGRTAQARVVLNRDGRPDRVLAGRATHRAAWYLNLAQTPANRSITP